MVDTYKTLQGVTQPEAVADMLRAGYAQLVGIPLSLLSGGKGPAQRGWGWSGPANVRRTGRSCGAASV
jgi:hypothetical protein